MLCVLPVALSSLFLVQTGYGERNYSWDQKLVFALKATELGTLLDGKTAESQGISLFHDPDKNTAVSAKGCVADGKRRHACVACRGVKAYVRSLTIPALCGVPRRTRVPRRRRWPSS